MPRSTYYYEIKRYEEPDKYETIKNEIKVISLMTCLIRVLRFTLSS